MTETDIDDLPIDESTLNQLIDERVEQRLNEQQATPNRRQVLGSLFGIGGAGALGYLGGQKVAAAPADAEGTLYVEQLGDSNNPVSDLYVDQQTTLNDVESFTEVDVTNSLGIPVYSSDTNAPNETHYWNDSDVKLKYKDSSGNVHQSGLWEDTNGSITPTTTEKAISVDKIDSSSGYTWQDLTASRSLDTWETAPTDRDIYFVVTVQASATDTSIFLAPSVNDSQTTQDIMATNQTINDTNRMFTPVVRVPAGREYKVRNGGDTANYSLDNWRELR